MKKTVAIFIELQGLGGVGAARHYRQWRQRMTSARDVGSRSYSFLSAARLLVALQEASHSLR